MNKMILALMLGVTGVTGLFAQAGAGGGGMRGERGTPPTPEQMVQRRVERLTTLLTLDPTQQAQAKTIFTDEQTAFQGMRDKMIAAHEAVQSAVKNSASDAQIDSLAAQVGTLQAQSLAVQAKAQAKFRSLLNSAQREKLDAAAANRGPGGPMHGGPGGPGGPGMMRRGGF